MTKYERFKDFPHFDLIEENKPIVIPSVFMFESHIELYSFMAACKAYNCTVFFENEKLIVPPNADMPTQVKLMCYANVAGCREIGDAYVRYLGDLAKMQWVGGEHEPILEEN